MGTFRGRWAWMVCCVLVAAPLSAGETTSGSVPDRKEYDYWQDGSVRECRLYDAAGDLAVKSFYREGGSLEKRERYDREGRLLQECFYDQAGKLCDGVDGWAAARKRYYANGALAEESYYGDDGYLKERKRYTMSGDLADTQYWGDDDIDPNDEFNPYLLGETTQEFYDSYGDLESTATAYRE